MQLQYPFIKVGNFFSSAAMSFNPSILTDFLHCWQASPHGACPLSERFTEQIYNK